MGSTHPAPGFHEVVGIEMTDADPDAGTATVLLRADDRHLNGHGTVHGGAIATLVDVAMGGAVAAAGVEAPATIEMKVTYLEPGRKGQLRASATVRKRGRRITIVEAEVTQEGDLVALALATFTA